MFRSNWTILRERMLSLAKATILWNWSVKIRRYMICGVVATSISGCDVCTVCCVVSRTLHSTQYTQSHTTQHTVHTVTHYTAHSTHSRTPHSTQYTQPHTTQHTVHTSQPEILVATTPHIIQRCIFTDQFHNIVTLARLSKCSLRMVQLDRNM